MYPIVPKHLFYSIPFIHGIRKLSYISHMIERKVWMSMALHRSYHYVYHGIITSRAPPYLYNKIQFSTAVHNINNPRKE